MCVCALAGYYVYKHVDVGVWQGGNCCFFQKRCVTQVWVPFECAAVMRHLYRTGINQINAIIGHKSYQVCQEPLIIGIYLDRKEGSPHCTAVQSSIRLKLHPSQWDSLLKLLKVMIIYHPSTWPPKSSIQDCP